jgi:hypothetical protein
MCASRPLCRQTVLQEMLGPYTLWSPKKVLVDSLSLCGFFHKNYLAIRKDLWGITGIFVQAVGNSFQKFKIRVKKLKTYSA